MGLSHTQKGILLALIGYSFFSISDTCVKWLGNSYQESTILFWAYCFALITCLVLAFPAGLKKTFKTKTPILHIVRSFCMVLLSYCAIAAFDGAQGLPLSTLYTIIFLFPSIAAILAIPIYKESVSKKSWLIILIGFAGIVVAFHKETNFVNPHILYAFGVLFFATAVSFLARPISKSDHILTFPFYPALISIPMMLAYTRGNISLLELSHLPIFILAGFSVCLAMACVLQSFRNAPYAVIAPAQYIQMILGLVIGYYIFGDVPNMWMLIGAGMVVASGMLLITRK